MSREQELTVFLHTGSELTTEDAIQEIIVRLSREKLKDAYAKLHDLDPATTTLAEIFQHRKNLGLSGANGEILSMDGALQELHAKQNPAPQ